MAELNGVPVTAGELQTLALVNYGHFTSMRVDDQHIRGLSHHMDRLVKDCREVFGAGLDRDRARELVRHAVGNQTGSCVVRVTVFDPALELGHPGVSADPHVLVTTRSAAAWPPAPMRAQSAVYTRDMPLVKHIGLFGAIRHRRNAQLNGFDDAVFIDTASFISEGATWNIAFFDGEQVVWPDAEVLPGVTMRLLQQVHEKTVTAPVSLHDLHQMQAAFATNTTVGVRPITAIDGIEFPADHEIFDSLRKEYEEIPAEQI
ncbi:branched-subunit amino acid aminotransferase/4-amino-4-deoxychorismate lyase [Spinactinospora alkalitolerans]|uniref:Branched-subunit amino acid aminotransferase/4-amino-4-deoxychorismate lyase n=1 Tax=Spinactinospora alkalitolerans TaxID=687207 RepID=A0A852UA12_9ACTN|nr:aminotransferase class IV family protein [Spinactinospora alkalitolerans]NYE50800.1 branched-subunit amino acid aminotransferase/4-amino-4-deoxychorismate lyase [Spinactinospora alkalitolerans]